MTLFTETRLQHNLNHCLQQANKNLRDTDTWLQLLQQQNPNKTTYTHMSNLLDEIRHQTTKLQQQSEKQGV